MSSSSLRDRKSLFSAVHRELLWAGSARKGEQTPQVSFRLVWGLSRADISSEAVVYELSSTLSLTRRNGFSVLLCPRSSAPQKLSPHLGFPLSPAPINLCSEELAVQTGNNALKSCLKSVFSNSQDVFAGTEGAVAHWSSSSTVLTCAVFAHRARAVGCLCPGWGGHLSWTHKVLCSRHISSGGTRTWHHLFRNPS